MLKSNKQQQQKYECLRVVCNVRDMIYWISFMKWFKKGDTHREKFTVASSMGIGIGHIAYEISTTKTHKNMELMHANRLEILSRE